MDAIECIKTRKSIRKFKPDPVPKEILTEIIDTAKWSPSYKNSQPWELMIVSGNKRQALTKMLIQLVEKDAKPSPDLPEPISWPEAEAARIRLQLQKRAQVMGSDLNDPKALKDAKRANFNFYGAPHALYLFQSAALALWSLFDLGLFTQSLLLSAHAKGLGTVPQAFATDYAQDIKAFLGIPGTKRLVLGISIGYPDTESPLNMVRSERARASEWVQWIE